MESLQVRGSKGVNFQRSFKLLTRVRRLSLTSLWFLRKLVCYRPFQWLGIEGFEVIINKYEFFNRYSTMEI